jgi:hypothetical protein
MDLNLRIKIDDLYLNRDVEFLQEVAPWETINIKGGFGRRRRNRNFGDVENGDVSTLLENINTSVTQLRTDVDTRLGELRNSINF